MASNYCSLVTDKEENNKYYNVWIATKTKGEAFRGDSLLAHNSYANSDGYEVYACFGSISHTGEPHVRHLGYFFSRIAAQRCAERHKRSKINLGYTLSIESDGQTLDLSELKKEDNIKINKQVSTEYKCAKKKSLPKLFEKINPAKITMTTSQKSRFSDILE